jgi:ribosomal protein S12 methylthiotransferase accessory factor
MVLSENNWYLIGAGSIADGLRRCIKPIEVLDPSSLADMQGAAEYQRSIYLVASDHVDLTAIEKIEQFALKNDSVVMPVFHMFGNIVCGPILGRSSILHDRSLGCLHCWITRYFSGRPQQYKVVTGTQTRLGTQAGFSASLCDHVAVAVKALLEDSVALKEADDVAHRALYINVSTLSQTERRYLPHSLCQRCLPTAQPSAGDEKLVLKSRPKHKSTDERLVPLRDIAGRLESTYLDPMTGLVKTLTEASYYSGSAVTTTMLYVNELDSEPIYCAGLTGKYSDSRPIAILEALERYCGAYPRRPQMAARCTFDSVASIAVDPEVFGVPDYAALEQNSGIRPFDKSSTRSFVRGYSFKRDASVLIPTQLAYYSRLSETDPPFLIEGSQGCAIGSCMEEAIFHGLFEVIERDSFMMTWYAKLPTAKLPLTEIKNTETLARLRNFSERGYDVTVHAMHGDGKIPALLVRLKNRKKTTPFSFSMPAAGLDPEDAILRACREIAVAINKYTRLMEDPVMVERARHFLTRPSAAADMMDHGLIYCLPESEPYGHFLDEATDTVSMDELKELGAAFRTSDMRDDLCSMIDYVLEQHPDVIVVDQTCSELAPLNLSAVKVLIPGMMTMHASEDWRRFTGLPRFDMATAGGTSINPWPHPFCP